MGLLAKLLGKGPEHERRTSNAKPASLYRGVQIVAGEEGCCRFAKILDGQRFLSDEIPKLPLDQCDVDECRCRYKLFDDRRTGERRLSDFGVDIISELRTDENQRGDVSDRRGESKDEAASFPRIASAFR